MELSVDHRFNASVSAFANYSWQAKPAVLDAAQPFPPEELGLPPTNRFNAGFNYDGTRTLASVAVNYSDKALWSDVLSSPYHGFTDAYTLVNGSFGVKFAGGKLTTILKVNNLLNKDVQQHVFGDIIKKSVLGELRIHY